MAIRRRGDFVRIGGVEEAHAATNLPKECTQDPFALRIRQLDEPD